MVGVKWKIKSAFTRTLPHQNVSGLSSEISLLYWGTVIGK